jgi:hypothetical protein
MKHSADQKFEAKKTIAFLFIDSLADGNDSIMTNFCLIRSLRGFGKCGFVM